MWSIGGKHGVRWGYIQCLQITDAAVHMSGLNVRTIRERLGVITSPTMITPCRERDHQKCCRCLGGGVGRDSSVGIPTHYLLDSPGIESRWGTRFSAPVQTGPEAHRASYTICTVSFSGLKRPGCGVDHPHHLAPRLKKE